MIRFICWVLAIGLAIGFGPQLATVTAAMAKSTIHAHMHDQMSYARFTKALLNAKPRVIPKDRVTLSFKFFLGHISIFCSPRNRVFIFGGPYVIQ